MGSARIDQNFASVNEHVRLDGVDIYFFSSEFTKLLTLFKDHLYYFFVVYMYHTADTTFFLESARKLADEEKFT